MTENILTLSADGRTITTTLGGLERVAESMAPTEDESKFSEAPEVQAIANRLISRREYFGHLADARISYLFRSGLWTSKGSIMMGKAYVMNEQQRFNTGLDLQVIINREVWEHADETQREALVAHELCHFEAMDPDPQGNPRWRSANHDLEEFSYIVRHYGLWGESLRQFIQAYEAGETERLQLSLDFEEDQAS